MSSQIHSIEEIRDIVRDVAQQYGVERQRRDPLGFLL